MAIEAALYEYLSSEATLTAIRGTRLSWWRTDSEDAKPYQTIQIISSQRDEGEHMAGGTGLLTARLQINSFADDAPTASSLNEATRVLVSATRGTIGSGGNATIVTRMFWDDGFSDWEAFGDGSERGVFVYRSDFVVWYQGDSYTVATV